MVGGQFGPTCQRLDQPGGDQKHQLCAVVFELAASEQRAQYGQVAQQRNARHAFGDVVFNQPRNGQALAVHQLHRGLHTVGGEVGYQIRGAAQLKAGAFAQFRHLGSHPQVDAPCPKHGGRELDAHTVLALLKGDKVATATRAHHRYKNFATRQKTGLLPADGNDVGLGQHFK